MGGTSWKAPGQPSPWTQDRVEQLTKLWGEGHSAGQVADRLGGDISRNAVISKVHRLGLPGRMSLSPHARGPMKFRKPKAAKPKVHKPKANPLWAMADKMRGSLRPEPLPPPVEEFPGVGALKRTVATIEPNECRWPLGDPGHEEFYFCGLTQLEGHPYCPSHCQRAYARPVVRREQAKAQKVA